MGDKHNLTRKQILQEFTDVRLFDMNRFLNQTYHPFTIKGWIISKRRQYAVHHSPENPNNRRTNKYPQ